MRYERGTLARSVLAPTPGGGGGGSDRSGRGISLGGGGEGGGGVESREAAAVAAVAAADPLLHRMLQTVSRRLRTMPRLAGGRADADSGGGKAC